MSNEYTWDLKRPERSQEELEIYDVQAAKMLLVQKPRQVELVQITAKYLKFFRDLMEGVQLKPDVEWEMIDMELPVIFGTAEGKFPIDGRHRLEKMLRMDVKWIPTLTLSKEETVEIRLV